ncbi:MAG: hypothetical protein OQK25_06535 [Gammaproteobacteria bacterium]|nr:hypothetical protein [Gammaproteobacteria bacterium]
MIILIVLAAGAAFLYLLMKISINRSISRIQQPPAEIPDDMVKCFSCGHVVPVKSALEKKGRYFCGLKKSERDASKDDWRRNS